MVPPHYGIEDKGTSAPLPVALDSTGGAVYFAGQVNIQGKGLGGLDIQKLDSTATKATLVKSTSSSTALDAHSAAMAIDAKHDLCVTYVESTSSTGRALKLLCRVGNSWKASPRTVDNTLTGSKLGTRVQMDDTYVHIAYQTGSGTSAEVRYARCERSKL